MRGRESDLEHLTTFRGERTAGDIISRSQLPRRVFLGGTLGALGLLLSGSNSILVKPPFKPLALPPYQEVVAYYDEPGPSHQSRVKTLGQRGYRPISLSLYDDPARPLYAAVWIKSDGPQWYTFQDLKPEQYQQVFDTWTARGYRPTIFTATGSGSAQICAGLFEQDSLPFVIKHNLLLPGDSSDSGTLQYWNSWANDNQYILRWGSIYGDAAHPRCTAIWEQNNKHVGWNWDADFYDTPNIYQQQLQAQVAQWAYPVFITGAEDRHTWTVYRNDIAVPHMVSSNLSENDYRMQAGQLQARGYYPSIVQGAGIGQQRRFSAVFVKNEALPARRWTQTGPQVPALAAFSGQMQAFMHDHDVRAGSLAIVKDGRLVFAQSYTWAEAGYPITQPTSLFRIASCTKPLTSILIHQLVERGLLNLDTSLQQILHLLSPDGQAPQDSRFNDIRIWHLLAHMGGWDRNQAFDPLLSEAHVARAMNAALPLSKYQIASFMAGQPLQFTPGTRFAYSNLGYCLLGQVLEKFTGLPYQQALRAQLYSPLGLKRPLLGHSLVTEQAPGEVRYHATDPLVEPGVLSAAQPLMPIAYGVLNLANHDANGGQVMSAPDYAKVLAAFDQDASNPLLHPDVIKQMWSPPPAAGPNILYGWFSGTTSQGHAVIGHDGYLLGAQSMVFRRSDRISFVVFFNRDLDVSLAIDGSGNDLSNALSGLADQVTAWPKNDLFPLMDIPAFAS